MLNNSINPGKFHFLSSIYDKAEANAVMQKAITILSIWEGLSRKQKDKFHQFINDNCSPLTEDYDDDLTQADDDGNIKKVTIEIKVCLSLSLSSFSRIKSSNCEIFTWTQITVYEYL